ncbi:hypothetical protein BCV70DRAFT_198174 [Testicularia cyperi]|uniref:Uncharacterized protein n=1 Tax=Testicularia cyperi TaxID=1882483 RepID=A0A317XVP5_9BASI|nr:hypothetical protein BCV70DRAFT_198174 [Testicularia cyperi]
MTMESVASSAGSSRGRELFEPPVETRVPGSFHVVRDPSGEAVMSWDYIVKILSEGDLDQLQRHKSCDDGYRAWAPPIKLQYGGLENYIRKTRLGWPAEQYKGPVLPSMLDRPQRDSSIPTGALGGEPTGAKTGAVPAASGACTPNGSRVVETWPEKTLPHPRNPDTVLRCFTGDLQDEDGLTKTILNDWPYGIPADARHWVVWSKLPIIHPVLFQDPDTPFSQDLREELYDCVTGDGVRGFTGFASPPTAQNYTFPRLSSRNGDDDGEEQRIASIAGNVTRARLAAQNSAAEASHANGASPHQPHAAVEITEELASQAHYWAGRHIRQYVERRWPPHLGFQTAWFCNPPGLRTVPGLSHFHVVVRYHGSEN